MENFKIKNKILFEAGGKREAGRDDKLTFFLWGLTEGYDTKSMTALVCVQQLKIERYRGRSSSSAYFTFKGCNNCSKVTCQRE
jgi:hypothetical protein